MDFALLADFAFAVDPDLDFAADLARGAAFDFAADFGLAVDLDLDLGFDVAFGLDPLDELVLLRPLDLLLAIPLSLFCVRGHPTVHTRVPRR